VSSCVVIRRIPFGGKRDVQVNARLDDATFSGGRLQIPVTTEDGHESVVWSAALGLTPLEVRYARQKADRNNF